jgi:hypothetical protein
MQRAISYFSNLGFKVEDVSRTECFDLRCSGLEGHFDVEVKGTVGRGMAILLTTNEVRHAETSFPNIVLFVVAEIKLGMMDGRRFASGGSEKVYQPWRIDPTLLEPQSYKYALDTE